MLSRPFGNAIMPCLQRRVSPPSDTAVSKVYNAKKGLVFSTRSTTALIMQLASPATLVACLIEWSFGLQPCQLCALAEEPERTPIRLMPLEALKSYAEFCKHYLVSF